MNTKQDETIEPIANALYAASVDTPEVCQEIAEGIVKYIFDAGFAIRKTENNKHWTTDWKPTKTENCGSCQKCRNESYLLATAMYSVPVVCPECGNKRCPKATFHKFKCTGSNEPGQTGSIYL